MKKLIFILICSLFAFYSCDRAITTIVRHNTSTLTDAEKIVGLSIVWIEAKYNFVYFDQLTLDWDSLFQATIPKVLATQNDFEYFRALRRFVAQLQDGHTSVWWCWTRNDLWASWTPLPIETRLIDGKMIITEVHDNRLKRRNNIRQGLEIIKINGTDVHEYVATYIKPYINSSTEQWLNFRAYSREATSGNISESVLLTLRDENNQIFESRVLRTWASHNPPPRPLFEFTLLEHNIGLLRIDDFFRENFTGLFAEVYDKILATDALIIDLRDNLGGNTNNAVYVLSHFTDETFQIFDYWMSLGYVPARASWGQPREWVTDEWTVYQPVENRPIYNRPIAVLINEGTFSTAEDFCIGFRHINNGLIIGTPSGGSTGNPHFIPFPFGGGVQFCSLKSTNPKGIEYIGIGILPDIEVRETVSSFFARTESGADNTNAVRKAIEILKGKL